MTSRILLLIGFLLIASVGFAVPRDTIADGPLHIRATVELTDGSRLIGMTTAQSLPVVLDYAQIEIPLDRIRRWEAVPPTRKTVGTNESAGSNKVSIYLNNGDRFTGTLNQSQVQLDTILGPLAPKLELIRNVSYTCWRQGNMPPRDGDISFGGLNWLAWHTEFAFDGDKLKSLPKARAGFLYGHEGHGRGPMLVANIGDQDWRNYRLDVQLCATGVDPSFNPYGLGNDFYDASVMFHIADAKESFNERGSSFYILGFHGATSTWELRAVYNSYCDRPVGWGNPKCDGDRTLAQGSGLAIDRQNGNHVRLDVVGEQIKVWVDDQCIVDVTDPQMSKEIGGQRLDHGGIGFGGGFDAMFWIKDLSVRAITDN